MTGMTEAASKTATEIAHRIRAAIDPKGELGWEIGRVVVWPDEVLIGIDTDTGPFQISISTPEEGEFGPDDIGLEPPTG